MPLRNRYDAVLLKKRWSRGNSFWPQMSTELALRLNNAIYAKSSIVDPRRIVDELCYLEGVPGAKPTCTRQASQLSGPTLGRFMHKHYTSAAFLARNLQNQWFEGYGAKHGLLSEEIKKVFEMVEATDNRMELWQRAGQVADAVVSRGYERRANRGLLTGEWIIYYVHEGKNYYLDIALHREAETPEAEKALFDRLKQECEWEFPFAFEE